LNPKIIDIVDTFSVFGNQAKKRFGVYKKRKYSVEDIMIDIDNLKVLSKKTHNFNKSKKDKSSNEEEDKKKPPKLAFSKPKLF